MKNSNIKKPQRGASLVEYALLVSLIALTALSAVKNFGTELQNTMACSNAKLANAGGGTETGIDHPEDPCDRGVSSRHR